MDIKSARKTIKKSPLKPYKTSIKEATKKYHASISKHQTTILRNNPLPRLKKYNSCTIIAYNPDNTKAIHLPEKPCFLFIYRPLSLIHHKDMVHCAIIGAGQIGSRHLQALCHLEKPTRVDLVDPSDESLHTARDRYEEAIFSSKQDTKLYCHHSLDDLPTALDIVIIATNSVVRKKVIKDVIEKYSVKNFILEKVLFQSKDQFVEVDTLLKKSSIPTWVNCWMRTTDLFKQIKSALNLNDPIQMKINGPQWGMGTNSVHFMDLLSFFTECVDYNFTGVHLRNKVLDSKREGFKEFMGPTLKGRILAEIL